MNGGGQGRTRRLKVALGDQHLGDGSDPGAIAQLGITHRQHAGLHRRRCRLPLLQRRVVAGPEGFHALDDQLLGLLLGQCLALSLALGLGSFLRTALISSGVAFVGYGPLVAWYIPNRWLDYLMGCVLAAGAALLSDGFRRQQQRRAASRRPAPACPSPPGTDTWSG